MPKPLLKYPLVLFDWNGTLLDDSEAWYKAVSATFHAFDVEPPSVARYFREFEGDYLAPYRSRGIEAPRDALNDIYREAYRAHVHEAQFLETGIAALMVVKILGGRTGLISGQQKDLVTPFLHKNGEYNTAGGRYDTLFHYTEFHVLNKAETIVDLCEREGVKPKQCVYVGDTPSDVRHAKRAGAKACAYMNGHIPEDLIHAAKPDFVIYDLIDIVDVAEGK